MNRIDCSGYLRLILAVLTVSLFTGVSAAAEVTQARVDAKAAELLAFIRSSQNADGSFARSRQHQVGTTALAVMAMREAGVSAGDRAVRRACEYLATTHSTNTYEEGLVPCALELVDPERYRARIRAAANFLASGQGAAGAWGYSNSGGNDESCSQFAILGLAAAERCGIPFPAEVKRQALEFFYSVQNPDGGWGYRQRGSTLAMTAAGLASLALLGERLDQITPKCDVYVENHRMLAGVNRLEVELRGFAANPGINFRHYALYTLERAAIFLTLKTIGDIDWYRAGCAAILADDSWRSSPAEAALALLFIAKNAAPYAVTKWRWNGDWNNVRYDVPNWVEHVASELDTPLDWQTASLADGLGGAGRASMIFLNGRKRFQASDAEIAAIREFLELGGVVVAESLFEENEFLLSFAKEVSGRLYPGRKLKFSPLADSHPILNNVNQIPAEAAGIYGLGAGCSRRQVYLLTSNISCVFNGSATEPGRVERARAIGVNLLAYALGRRKPAAKFAEIDERPVSALEMLAARAAAGTGAPLRYDNPLGRLRHGGEWDTAPSFFDKLRTLLAKTPGVPLFDGESVLDPESEDIFACSTVYMTGMGAPVVSDLGVANLRRHLAGGGSLLAMPSASCPEFNQGFKALLARMLPNNPPKPIPLDDPIHNYPNALRSLPLRSTKAYQSQFGENWPRLHGVAIDGRWAVVFCEVDLGCDFEGMLDEDTVALRAPSAFPLLANILTALNLP